MFRLILIALAVGVLGLFVIAAPPAQAKCNPASPTRTSAIKHYWLGEYSSFGSVDTITALGRNYDPWVNPGPYHPEDREAFWSISWVMLAERTTGEYAQAGWMEMAYDERYTFSEFSINGVHIRRYFGAFSESTSTVYRVDRDGWYVYFRAGPPSLEGLPPPVFDVNWAHPFDPDESHIQSEIPEGFQQMAGGRLSAYQMKWDAAYQTNNSGQTWIAFNGSPVNTQPLWFGYGDRPPHPVYGGGSFATWDKACSW